jgi:DUF4097 and DUF4098 domain-containing protein YvlB
MASREGDDLAGRNVLNAEHRCSGLRTYIQGMSAFGGGGLMRAISVRSGFAVALAACALAFAGSARADHWEKTYTISGHAQLHLETNDGSVEITPSNSNTISARVETGGWKLGSPDEVMLEEHQTGDSVEIQIRLREHHNWGFGINNRWIHVYLDVPKQADLDIHTGDGGISAHDITGNLRLDSGDGSLHVDSLKGDLKLHTGDGRIEGAGLDGNLNADSGDGSLLIRGRFDRVDAHTGDGNIDLAIENGSKMAMPWMVRTGDGRIHMRLPDSFDAELDAHTGDGRISTEFPMYVNGSLESGTLRGKIGNGGQSLTLRSGDGSISIEKL